MKDRAQMWDVIYSGILPAIEQIEKSSIPGNMDGSLEIVILSEISQREKDKYIVITYMQKFKKVIPMKLIYKQKQIRQI